MSEKNIWYESEIETLKKEIPLVREEAQVEKLQLQKAISHLHENIKMKDDDNGNTGIISQERLDENSEVQALKQQLHTERESLKKEADELMMKKIEHYEKEIALVREDAQVEILRLEKRNSEHQKLNGELQEKLSKYEDKAAHYRRKAVL